MKNILKSILIGALCLNPIFPAFAQESTTPPAIDTAPVQSTEPAPTTAPSSDTTPYYEKDYDVKPDNFKPMSMTTGLLLGFSPVNGDGMFYTGHYVTGGILLGVEALGIPLIVFGAPALGESAKEGLAGIGNAVGKAMFITGMIMFGTTYVIDAALTPVFVSKHNKALKSAERKKFQPYFGATDKRIEAGVSFTF